MAAATGALAGQAVRFRQEPHVVRGGGVAGVSGYAADRTADRRARRRRGRAGRDGLPRRDRRARRPDRDGGRPRAHGGRPRCHVSRTRSTSRIAPCARVRFEGMQRRTRHRAEGPRRPVRHVKYAVVTFGCRVNQADSLEIEGGLRARGGVSVPPAQADVVVVNTCSVTGAADQGARQTIRRIGRENPGARIVVTGCYATREPGDLAALPGVVRVVPNPEKDRLLSHVPWPQDDQPAIRGTGRTVRRPGAAWRRGPHGASRFACRPAAMSTAATASFRPRAAPGGHGPLGWVLRAIDAAVAAGYREIALCGVHLGSYGRDLDDGSSLRVSAAPPRRMAGRRAVPHQLARADGLHSRDRGARGVVAAIRAALPPAAAARCRRDAARDAPPVHRRLRTSRWSMESSSAMPDACDRHRRDRRISRRNRRAGGHAGEAPGAPAAVVRPRLFRTRIVRVPKPAAWPGRSTDRRFGRAARACAPSAKSWLRSFRASQVGTVRRALVVDDGTSVVTDNYLKLAIDQVRARNEWVDVRVDGAQLWHRLLTTPSTAPPAARPSCAVRLPRSADRTPRGCHVHGSFAPTP